MSKGDPDQKFRAPAEEKDKIGFAEMDWTTNWDNRDILLPCRKMP